MSERTFYITTPIYYVNAEPHIGTAYTTLVCDIIARQKRLEGYTVKFLTGTDEHGQKVEATAKKNGLETQEFVDKVSEKFRELFELMNISNDDFIRTTEERHKKAAIHLWNTLKEKGHIYLGKYAGWYAVRDESFYSEDELVNGKAPTGAEVEWVEEESYFFDLSKWQDKLIEFYEKNPEFVTPKGRFSEIINFVKSGLRDLSVSRTTFEWGIPIPDAPGHIMYVWLDALTNYISAIGYPDETGEFKKFWPADAHVVGKDITKFHAIYWPAFLMASDIEVPKQVVSHGWWLNEGEKISKSLGNVIDPVGLIKEYGLDQVRYYLMREMSFGQDGNFTYESFINRVNSDLANKLGNLIHRTLSMIYKNCDEQIPSFSSDEIKEFYKNEELLQTAELLPQKVFNHFNAYEFHKSLEVIFEFIDKINVYIDRSAPWKLLKTDTDAMRKVLYIVLESARYPVSLLLPFIPDSANNILEQMKVAVDKRNISYLNAEGAISYNGKIESPSVVFKKIEV